MTLEAFLEWEERQPLRYEFDGFAAQAMTGGSADHSRVQRNLVVALTSSLRGSSCGAFGSELKILVGKSVRYPDAFVVCIPMPEIGISIPLADLYLGVELVVDPPAESLS